MSKHYQYIQQLLDTYHREPSTKRRHDVAQACINTIKWLAFYCYKENQRLEPSDALHECYFKIFQWVVESKDAQFILNKASRTLRYAGRKYHIIPTESIEGVDTFATILNQSIVSPGRNKLLDLAFDLLWSDKTGVLLLFSKGYWIGEIEERSGIPKAEAQKIIKAAKQSLGWQPRKRNLTDLSDEILKRYRQGKGMKAIAYELEVSYKKVRGAVQKSGLKRKTIERFSLKNIYTQELRVIECEKNTASNGIQTQLSKLGIRNEAFYKMKRQFLGVEQTGYSYVNGWKLIGVQEELMIEPRTSAKS
ncbi:hypothetical protein LC593_10765 [Nostoc sp. CHAB 5844]|nr:hypothetical protein [Nostoc sp. CHAB 5844]